MYKSVYRAVDKGLGIKNVAAKIILINLFITILFTVQAKNNPVKPFVTGNK